MTKRLLITRPNHDVILSYIHFWNNDVIQLAKDKGFQVKDLEGKQADKEILEEYLEKQQPVLIFLNGHGNSTTICGHDNKPLVDVEQNVKLLKSSIVHALSCNSSEILGEAAVKAGAGAYLGYTLPFSIVTDKSSECKPGKDRLAELFKEPALEAPKNLVKGRTVGEAYAKAKKRYKEAILSFSLSNSPLEAEYIRFALFSNMQAFDLKCNDSDACAW